MFDLLMIVVVGLVVHFMFGIDLEWSLVIGLLTVVVINLIDS
jgi:hypothetical protein